MTAVAEIATLVSGFGRWWWVVLLGILVGVGVAPQLAFRLLLRAFPAGHERCDELRDHMWSTPYATRWLFVFSVLELVICEAVPARIRRRREAKRASVEVGDDIESTEVADAEDAPTPSTTSPAAPSVVIAPNVVIEFKSRPSRAQVGTPTVRNMTYDDLYQQHILDLVDVRRERCLRRRDSQADQGLGPDREVS